MVVLSFEGVFFSDTCYAFVCQLTFKQNQMSKCWERIHLEVQEGQPQQSESVSMHVTEGRQDLSGSDSVCE